jgi:hypothetical protein
VGRWQQAEAVKNITGQGISFMGRNIARRPEMLTDRDDDEKCF